MWGGCWCLLTMSCIASLLLLLFLWMEGREMVMRWCVYIWCYEIYLTIFSQSMYVQYIWMMRMFFCQIDRQTHDTTHQTLTGEGETTRRLRRLEPDKRGRKAAIPYERTRLLLSIPLSPFNSRLQLPLLLTGRHTHDTRVWWVALKNGRAESCQFNESCNRH